MQTFVITKEDIIHALRTEKLTSDRWLGDPSNSIIFDPSCASCAVGSILKRKVTISRLMEFTDICEAVTDNCYTYEDIVDEDNWIGALSVVWEYLNANNVDLNAEEYRDDIVNWAEDNIPEDYEQSFKITRIKTVESYNSNTPFW